MHSHVRECRLSFGRLHTCEFSPGLVYVQISQLMLSLWRTKYVVYQFPIVLFKRFRITELIESSSEGFPSMPY